MTRTEELDQVIGDWCGRHDLETVLAKLAEAQVPAGKIYDIADIVRDVHYRARGMIDELHIDGGQAMKVPGIVPKLSATPGQTRWAGPRLGEHTGEVLKGIDFSDAEIAQLRFQGVIG